MANLNKEDATELLDLDVRFVSGVGEPATGKRFLLFKAKEGAPMDEVQPTPAPEQPDLMAELGRRLAVAFGVRTADDSLTEATKAMQQIASALTTKAKGQAPADDTSGTPSYAGMNTPKKNLPGKAPTDDATNPKLAEKGVDGTTAADQPDTLVGSEVTTPNRRTVQAGTPVVPVTKSVVQRMLSKLAADAPNPQALADAQAALEAAFQTPEPEEEHMRDEEVRDLLLKALEPIIDAVEELQGQADTLTKSLEAAEDPRVDQVIKQLEYLGERFDRIETSLSAFANRTAAEPAQRPVAKTRVPTIVTQVTAKDALWNGSPFDVAAEV